MASKSRLDKMCLVTGGTQGLGWAMVQALAAAGAEVYGCGLSAGNFQRATQAAAARPDAGRIHLSQCDVTDERALAGWIGQAHAQTGRVDVLINNAAYVRWTNVLEMSVAEAEETMRVGYNGMVYGVKQVLPLMLPAGQGHIINIGSITGSIFVGGASAAYSAAKAAMDAYTQTLQIELRHTPVRVSLVRLGAVAGTDFFKKHVSHTRMPRMLDFFPPLQPQQVAQAIVRLVERPRPVLTMPAYYRPLRLFYQLAPGLLRRLTWLAGSGQRRYDV